MGERLLFTLIAAVLTITFLPQAVLASPSTSLLITEVQTHSATSSTEEFIELQNVQNAELNVSGWKIEYLTSTGSAAELAVLTGTVTPHGFVLLSKASYLPNADGYFTTSLSNTAGHVRIVDNHGDEIDRVGWGSAGQPEKEATPAHAAGLSHQRKLTAAGTFIESDNNKNDFEAKTPTPQAGGLQEPEAVPCNGIEINELLPNPAGVDSDGGEFVELYNPTAAPVNLKECSLATDKTSSITLPDILLPAGAYYKVATRDQLLNNGGTVTLTTSASELVVSYPSLAENQAWAVWAGTWQTTLTPTPGADNIITTDEPGEGGGESSVLEPCPAGKFRNPETNRCKNIEEPDGVLAACQPGEVRNPDTNRCRKVVAATTALATCQPGYERNPSTNRCRKIAATSAGLQPCEPGQERNPETNRCRKIAGTVASATTTATTGGNKNSLLQWWPLAVGATGVIGYGLYEYRQDIRNRFRQLKVKFTSKN